MPGIFSSVHYRQNASASAAFSRSATRRRSAFAHGTAIPLESRVSTQSSKEDQKSLDDEEKDVGIRVLTEVHISFDKDDEAKDKDQGGIKSQEHRMKREDSCEKLIGQAATKLG